MRVPIANIRWIIEKAREFQENICFCFIDYVKPLCGSQQTVKNFLGDGNTRPPCLSPEKLVYGQEAIVRTLHGTTDWLRNEKGVQQGYVSSPCLFNLYVEYIMRNIKIGGRNINNFRYADDTTFMAESEEELKSLLMKVKEESEKVGFKLNIQK